jgi:antitoxin VapB
MAISIKDPKTDELARKISALTGESLTETIQNSLLDRLKVLQRSRIRSMNENRIREIQEQVRTKLPKDVHSLDHGDLLYDENGLPR